MFKRLLFACLIALNLAFALGITSARAEFQTEAANDPTICRRLYGTPEWTRRCAPQRPDESYEAYCRRIWGTDEWTRRCAPQGDSETKEKYCRRIFGTTEWTRRCLPDEKFDEYCRRVWGTDEWTRRCLPQRPDEDREKYCRRIYGADEWTRRCLQLLTPTPEPRPTEVVVRPVEERPVQITPAPSGGGGGRP